MLKKIGAGILVATIAVAALPQEAVAQNSKKQKEKIKKTFNKLKKLPNNASPKGKVDGLVKKLVKLDPKKANKYYKTALPKYPQQTRKSSAQSLQTAVDKELEKAVKKGTISEGQKKRLEKQIAKEEEKVPNPTPTPTPTPPYSS